MPELEAPLAPGSTIGILGGGQLGRMLAEAATNLDLKVHVFASDPESPAFETANTHICADFEDYKALAGFLAQVDIVTFEFENIPVATLVKAAEMRPIYPKPDILTRTQDRLVEKRFVQGLGIATAEFWPVETLAELERAFDELGGAGILKTRRFGYDGKGQVKITKAGELKQSWLAIGENPAILEEFVPFSAELSIILARGRNGEIELYDICENVHKNHILHTTTLPAAIDAESKRNAAKIATKIANGLDHVGVLAVELFLGDNGGNTQLRVNEIAPRVHNSGHWTLDGAKSSQFEQHIRAICGWPLGSPHRHSDVVMTNLIGPDIENLGKWEKDPNAKIHLYGKAQIKAGRKMGHVTQVSKR